jgi:hypothetical protein
VYKGNSKRYEHNICQTEQRVEKHDLQIEELQFERAVTARIAQSHRAEEKNLQAEVKQMEENFAERDSWLL